VDLEWGALGFVLIFGCNVKENEPKRIQGEGEEKQNEG
jgi:hypothetical protein